MNKPPVETLREGRAILDPLMNEYGFFFVDGPSGRSSGGPYASGRYVNTDRELEIHYRFSLGLVTYHFGEICIDHESYMRVVLGSKGGNKYPGYSDDPLEAFRDLAYDIENFGTAFLEGDLKRFASYATAAGKWRKIPGIARLP
ncbi:MAG: hypothetical protein ACHQIK_13300 [Candidatus Acidiferrales bacterium]